MQNKTVIIGLGSIGLRHAKILSSKNFSLYIFSRNNSHNYKKIIKINDIIDIDPDYIVISNLTYDHLKILRFIDKNFEGKKCLIEKPLFSIFNKNIPKLKNNSYYIGYILRFHPFYEEVKGIIKKDFNKIFHIEFNSSSYLPNWRTNIDYIKSSSSSKKSGGVIHDYSHEIDFILSLFGYFNINFVKHSKLSNLKIKSKDYLNINGSLKKINIDISLNYFSREPHRILKIFLNDKNYIFDFVNLKIYIYKNNKNFHKSTKLGKDELYINQHNDILSLKPKTSCSYEEGYKLSKFIMKINNYAK